MIEHNVVSKVLLIHPCTRGMANGSNPLAKATLIHRLTDSTLTIDHLGLIIADTSGASPTNYPIVIVHIDKLTTLDTLSVLHGVRDVVCIMTEVIGSKDNVGHYTPSRQMCMNSREFIAGLDCFNVSARLAENSPQ